MIPKIIHHIWFEDGPMTSTFLQCRKAWEQMHPDWEHHPWTGWRLPYRINKHLLQSHGFGSLAEEVLRFALLEEFGGFVVFPSFTCIHSLDHLCVSATALLIGTLDMPAVRICAFSWAPPRKSGACGAADLFFSGQASHPNIDNELRAKHVNTRSAPASRRDAQKIGRRFSAGS